MADSSDADESAADKKSFLCCKSKKSAQIVCINCGNIFHKSCLQRDFPHLSWEKGDSRTKCCNLTSTDFAKKLETNKYQVENEMLKKVIKELEDKYQLIRDNNRLLEDNNALLHSNNKLLEEKVSNLTKEVESTKNQNKTYSMAAQVNVAKNNVNTDISRTNLRTTEWTNKTNPVNLKTRERVTKNKSELHQNLSEFQALKMKEIINLGQAHENNDKKEDTENETNQYDDFEQVRPRRRYLKKRIGTGEVADEELETGFVGEDRKAWLYIYRVKRHVSEEQIITYIKRKPDFKDLEVTAKELPGDLRKLKHFAVTAPLVKKDSMYEPSFWPKGVGVRRFNFNKYDEYKRDKDFLV